MRATRRTENVKFLKKLENFLTHTLTGGSTVAHCFTEKWFSIWVMSSCAKHKAISRKAEHVYDATIEKLD